MIVCVDFFSFFSGIIYVLEEAPVASLTSLEYVLNETAAKFALLHERTPLYKCIIFKTHFICARVP